MALVISSRCLLIVALLAVAACESISSIGSKDGEVLSDMGQHFKSSNYQLPEINVFDLDEIDIQRMEYYLVGLQRSEEKARRIFDVLVANYGYGIRYDPSATQTAAETLLLGKANCLSFSIVYAAFAMEFGIPVSFNDVDVPPVWDLDVQQRMTVYKHVNSMADLGSGKKVMADINLLDFSKDYNSNIITRKQVEALYYSNHGVALMRAGDYTAAYYHLYYSIQLDSRSPVGWVNLGVLASTLGLTGEAELLYQSAIDRDPDSFPAYGNLARINPKGVSPERHNWLKSYRSENPYYWYSVAVDRYLVSNTGLDEVNRALDLKDDYRFYLLRAAIYQKLGNEDLATVNIEKGLALAEPLAKNRILNKFE